MPKISVLIPLYNRRQYAAECINSVLNQTFQDFELIIRDDCSTDGVFDFVRENFSDRRIKFLQNQKNFGEFVTRNQLTKDAQGKYLAILHNDDIYLPDALQGLYEVAEKFNADVVHASAFLLSDEVGGNSKLQKFSYEPKPAREIQVVPNDLNFRFNQWFNGEIFRDDQYNLFRRQFVLDGEIFSKTIGWDSLIVSLGWIMKAKILVKTPQIFYIRRENKYSKTFGSTQVPYSDSKYSDEISSRIELFRRLDKFISSFEFFRDNDVLKYKIKARAFGLYETLDFNMPRTYGDEKFAPLYKLIEDTFRKYFGDDAVYLAMMYHWAHLMHLNQNQLREILNKGMGVLNENI